MTTRALCLALLLTACGGARAPAPEPQLHAHAATPTPEPPPGSRRLPGRPHPPPDDAPAPPGRVQPMVPHPYTGKLAAILTARWTLPRGIPNIGSLDAEACLAIDASSGALLGFSMQRPSGFAAFDDSVALAITRDPGYPPAPPLPPNLANGLCFHFTAAVPGPP